MPTETTRNSPGPRDGVEIGAWRLYPSLNEIRQGETVVNLEPKAVALLVYLAGRVGETVSREELLSQVWPGSVVGDASYSNSPYPTDMGETGENEPLTIALLPFKALKQGTDQDNFARGFAADLSTDLSKLSSLWVISLPSAY